MALSRTRTGLAVRAVVAAVALYYAVWGGEYSAFDLRHLDRRRAAAQGELELARTEADSLRLVAKRVEDDAETIERIARERFGMIRPGETLVRFVPASAEVAKGP